jgi:aspartyl-tRNA(Asn)/glutamyl-tRNA(Gln) amidotransferase subunit B
MNDKYKAIIGLEMHCEVSETNSKVFSPSANSYSEEANVNINDIDLGFPGVLPVVNKEAIKKALMASLILNCKQPEYVYFERKNYYYPDLPKGFQLTQETKPCPIGIYGEIKYYLDGEEKIAKINNIHLEEDAASLDHYSTFSTINYNRCGNPLLELVTYPCFHTADEALAFIETMISIYRYAGISEADSKKGHIRCDVNVSIMESDKDENDEKNYGTRVEIKNVCSLGGIRDAINYEIKRQIELKETGKYNEMEQQTRRWDEDEQETFYMRSKANAIDYKYFIEPNIPKYKLTKEFIEEVKKSIPVLPNERMDYYVNELGLSKYDATILVKEKEISDYFNDVIKVGVSPIEASKWVNTIIIGSMNKLEKTLTELGITADMLGNVIKLVTDNKLSQNNAKKIIYRAIAEGVDPLKIIEEEHLSQIDDDDLIVKLVNETFDENHDVVRQFKEGKEWVANFFVGQVMKKTKGQANPNKTLETIKEEIKRR